MEKARHNYHVYINKSAGTVLNMGQTALEDLIVAHRLPVEHVYFLEPDDLLSKIKDHDPQAPALIGGGDGTIKSCAEILMRKKTGFGILPLGTMNLLAHDLGIPTPVEKAIKAYAKKIEPIKIDVGLINEHIFLCCVGIGTMPETSEYREQHRGDSQPILIPRITAYVMRQMDRVNRRKLTLTMDNHKLILKTSALVVSNNQYGPQDAWSNNNFKRKSLSDGTLGIYSAAPFSFLDKLRLLFRLQLGNWAADKSLKEWSCKELTIQAHEPEVLLSLDGETHTIGSPLTLSILRKALNVIVPVK